MYAKGAGFVGGGRNDAPAALSADDDRLALERGVVSLLDRRKKGVHIDMHDPATHDEAPLKYNTLRLWQAVELEMRNEKLEMVVRREKMKATRVFERMVNLLTAFSSS